jgi:dTDP-D-glucose 4,6-dehydratase
MSKHVLVTGCGGSIGCHVMQHLLVNTTWDITGIDSFRHKGLTDRLHDRIYKSPRVRVFTHDLMAPLSYITTGRIGPVDYIINLAAISDVDVSLDDPTYAIRTNVEVMLNMGEYARQAYRYTMKHPVFLHVSTDEVYGPTDGHTAHQEWDPIVPSNPYSASKACQEAIAISYWRSYSLPLIIVNIMNNFGEMQSGAKFPCMVQRAVRAGRTVHLHKFGTAYGSRFYIHSRNAADAMLFLLRNVNPHKHIPGTVDRPDRYNVVGDLQVNNLELAQFIALTLGEELKYKDVQVTDQRPGHDSHYGLDGTKLTELGWRPPVSFHESMRRTIKWYSENPEWLDPR